MNQSGYSRSQIFRLWLSLILLPVLSSVATGQVRFNRDIRPLLSRHCTHCHGPDESSREADLRLDLFENATADPGGYAAIVPGDPASSELMERITSADDPMPPEEHGEPLGESEIELFRQWIQEGARYETHWSFRKPVPRDPPAAPATGEHAGWSTHPVDRFVLEKMRAAGLQPNPPAEPARLVRRLALDLTGLPPAREMVDRYVARPTPETYERLVDELLADPAFGEHWASMWLDLARYADTVGYAGDETRTIWPWRDWLIRALNDNLPFDQFTLQVLAGDLLPEATVDQRLATAFHRNTLNNNEGGTSDEEFRTIAVKDRVSTTLNTWMGLTVRCAECHSHKYDPVSQTEYYQLVDFFNQTADSDQPDERPRLAPDPSTVRRARESLDRQIALTWRELESTPETWRVVSPTETKSARGTRFEPQADRSVLAVGTNPASDEYSLTFQIPPGVTTGLRVEVLPDRYHNGNTGRGAAGAFVMTQVRVEAGPPGDPRPVLLSDVIADFTQSGQKPEHLLRQDIRESDEPAGWAVLHPQEGYRQTRSVIFSFQDPLVAIAPVTATVHLVFNSRWHHSNAGRVRLSITDVAAPVEAARQGNLEPLKRRLKRLMAERNRTIEVPVLAELPSRLRRVTHVMKRGNYQNLAEVVSAGVPVAFHEFPAGAPRNRLGIARWLLHADNPLTARVTVNRYWARLFGKGIVVTEEDFGTQGAAPTHQALLDWLAVDFQKNGWDTKRLIRQIVTSRTYRQSARTTAAKQSLDPKNDWLSRGPRWRLSAEALRDQALAISGLLSRKMYGPAVYPPSPIKRVVNAFQPATWWETSLGEDRYRRAIYTFLKRSQPHPLFDTFDISTREVCSLRRIPTNTPLQSFMTLNDEVFVEAAQALARHMQEAPATGDQIKKGLEMALLRPADPQKVSRLVQLCEDARDHYRQNPGAARRMIGEAARSDPDADHSGLAALTVVANVIMNLDEFLTR